MKQTPLEHWEHARIRHGDAWLDIRHPVGDGRCVEALVAFQERRLDGLDRVPSSTSAEVHRGRLYPEGPVCYFKRFLMRGWSDRLKHMFRPSRARRALLAGFEMESLGFHAPAPAGLLEVRRAGRVKDSVLVTLEVPDAPLLGAWLSRPDLAGVESRARRRGLLHALGNEVGKWHACGLCHGDMAIGNILASSFSGHFTFHWLDNERTRRFRALPKQERVANLLQLNRLADRVRITNGERRRFWNAYLETCPLPAATRRSVLRDFLRFTTAR